MATRKKKPTLDAGTVTTTHNQHPPDYILIQSPTPESISLARTTSIQEVDSVTQLVSLLDVKDQPSYLAADALLSHIKEAMDLVEEKFRPITKPIRDGLDKLYALRREIDTPLKTLETEVKGKMATYQMQERRRIQAEEEENQRRAREEARKLIEEREERLRLEALQTLQAPVVESYLMQGNHHWVPPSTSEPRPGGGSQATFLPEQVLVAFLSPPTAPAPSASSSSARFVTRCRVVNMEALVDAALLGFVPLGILSIDQNAMESWFKQQPHLVKSWPGVEVYEDAIISKR